MHYSAKIEQRPLDIVLNFVIDKPSEMPKLDSGEYKPFEKEVEEEELMK
jgi:hypothetical protein